MTLEPAASAVLEKALRRAWPGPGTPEPRRVAIRPRGGAASGDAPPNSRRSLSGEAVVEFEAGPPLHLFVKGLRSHPAGSPSMGGGEREAAAYRLLEGCSQVPSLHRHWRDPADGRDWLLLDHVSGRPLSASDSGERWDEAADLLASIHARFAGSGARLADSVLPDWSDPAWGRSFARTIGPTEAVVEGAPALDLDHAWRRAVSTLRAQPSTLVHGECFPGHVLVLPSGGVRLVDWEDAGWGAAAIDLEALLWGAPAALRRRVLARYAARAGAGGRRAADARALRAAALANRIRFLASWGPSLGDTQAADLLAEIASLLADD